MAAQRAFGPFVLDPERGSLLRDGVPLPLGQRALSVLEVLAEQPGRAVPKSELLARVWPGTVVEEGNLTVQVAALRKAMGEAAEGQSWILTVPRLGYRLLAGATVPSEPASPPRLAVLPFDNLGGDESGAWFADGVVEDLITALSRFRSFAVAGRAATFAARDRGWDARRAAAELGVRYLLEGSVRRAGGRLRITARLADDTGAPLWAENFDGGLDEVFDFQDRIAESVAMRVEPRIQAAEIARSRRERPGSIAAYDIHLRALASILSETEAGNVEAHALLVEGLAIEPDNPFLLSDAAWVLEHRATMGWTPFGPDDRARCADLARRGLEHADGDPTIMARCGMSLLQGARDYDWGLAVLQAAVEVNPNDPMIVAQAGVAHLHCGSLDQALALFHRASRLSPGDLGAHFALCGIADVYLIRGEHEEALAWAGRALAVNPNFDPTLWVLVAAHAHLGRRDEARRFLDALRRLTPGVTVAGIQTGQPGRDPGRIAALLEGLRLAGVPEGED